MNEFEKFYGKIRRTGTSLVITIPDQLVKFAGFEEGTEVKIMIQKQKEE